MTRQRLDRAAPEVVALCQRDNAGNDHVVGWAMLIAERVVAYVPDHPRIGGYMLLNTYLSLDTADRRLAYLGIRSVRDWSALLAEPADRARPRTDSHQGQQ
ncbi:MAG: hypothetical protein ACRDTC_05085 [Pseudonocardiaceae bacterium]